MFYGVKLDYFKCPKNLKYICDGAFDKAQIDKIILNDSIEFISINVLEYLESKCPDLYLKYDPYKSITDPVKNVLYKNYISSYKTRVQQYSRYSYANMYKRLDFSEFTLFDSYVYFKKSSVIYNNSIKNIYKDVPLYLKFIYKELISNKINDADISYIKDKLLDIKLGYRYLHRWTNVYPTVGLFLSNNIERINQLIENVPEPLWDYVKELSDEYIQNYKFKPRKGFWFI